jgi:hypothetical protein
MARSNQDRREFHPAVSISSWLLYAMAVEFSPPGHLPWLALPALGLLLHRDAARRFLQLVWKSRWLWLALMLLYAYTLPGVPTWQGHASPSLEGLQVGGLRVARLWLLLAALARLLVEFTPQQLAAGLFVLVRPLAGLEFDRRALAVRLALTLDQVQNAPPSQRWMERLRAAGTSAAGPEEIRLSLPAAGVHDASLLALAGLLLGFVLA